MSNGDYILPFHIKLVSLHSSCEMHHKKYPTLHMVLVT